MNQPALYRIEFGPAWPVPPITVDFSDRTAAGRQVAAHAIPYLTPKLTEMGRPEFADCFFHTDQDLTVGQFMWLDLAAGRGARFCPARLTAVEETEESHVVAADSDEMAASLRRDGFGDDETADLLARPVPAATEEQQ